MGDKEVVATIKNPGDQPMWITLAGRRHRIEPGDAITLGEDGAQIIEGDLVPPKALRDDAKVRP